MKLSSLFLTILLICPPSYADSGREFLMSCTYGVLTGALVGAATLAVEDDPDQKLHRIARGASLGLYTGILLGLYVVYMVPAQMENRNQGPDPEDVPGLDLDSEDPESDPETYDYDDGYEYQEIEEYGTLPPMPKMIVYPVFEQNRMTGAAVRLSVYSF